jgi:hypothetical protein
VTCIDGSLDLWLERRAEKQHATNSNSQRPASSLWNRRLSIAGEKPGVLSAARKALSDRYERKFASDIAFKNEPLGQPTEERRVGKRAGADESSQRSC